MMMKAGVVLDGAKLIATVHFNRRGMSTGVLVHKDYQRQGLGLEIVWQRALRGWLSHNVADFPMTANMQALCGKLYDKIQANLPPKA